MSKEKTTFHKKSVSNSHPSNIDFDLIDELHKYDIDARNPTGIYAKRGTDHVLIVSYDKAGNFYITKALSHFSPKEIELNPIQNYPISSFIELESELSNYHKLSRKAQSRVIFSKK